MVARAPRAQLGNSADGVGRASLSIPGRSARSRTATGRRNPLARLSARRTLGSPIVSAAVRVGPVETAVAGQNDVTSPAGAPRASDPVVSCPIDRATLSPRTVRGLNHARDSLFILVLVGDLDCGRVLSENVEHELRLVFRRVLNGKSQIRLRGIAGLTPLRLDDGLLLGTPDKQLPVVSLDMFHAAQKTGRCPLVSVAVGEFHHTQLLPVGRLAINERV